MPAAWPAPSAGGRPRRQALLSAAGPCESGVGRLPVLPAEAGGAGQHRGFGWERKGVSGISQQMSQWGRQGDRGGLPGGGPRC